MITMYGIPNCDTIKKAKKWLEAEGIDYHFHDYRKSGIDAELITSFFQKFGWEAVVNKRGTTYRQLSDEQKNTLNQNSAISLLTENPAMIKRPILITESTAIIGFKAADYEAQLK
ncbi:ArsC family reductase [Vibrio algivorus]|uniref:ArsC family reductase n=1 Tax=Vibrio algivorus TaxID=1667024 RepID=A0A557PAD6_9VIBR|nr:ArsC family reductase [Vibrio algivorus]TVO37618.1 ArsC family reductase [Vibrio algivorus]GLT15649.1 arsenate reductase [Vibrio algivorus]